MYDDATPFPGVAALLPRRRAALVHRGRHGASGRVDPVLLARPCSDRPLSYGWYLWHWPVLILLTARFRRSPRGWPRAAAVTIVIAVPVAVAAYHLVEDPVRRMKRIRADWRLGVGLGVALVALSVGPPSYVYGALGQGAFDSGRPAAAVTYDGGAWPPPLRALEPRTGAGGVRARVRTDGARLPVARRLHRR